MQVDASQRRTNLPDVTAGSVVRTVWSVNHSPLPLASSPVSARDDERAAGWAGPPLLSRDGTVGGPVVGDCGR